MKKIFILLLLLSLAFCNVKLWNGDNLESQGLNSVRDSLGYRVGEVERHFHSYERWLGKAITPNTTVHVADRITDNVVAFQIDAGNNTWGSWVQILGSSDTPIISGKKYFDLHRLMITDAERGLSHHFIQIAFGDDANVALANETYTEFVYRPLSGTDAETPFNIQSRRMTAGTKVWARVRVPAQNTGTVDFYLGLHEYEN